MDKSIHTNKYKSTSKNENHIHIHALYTYIHTAKAHALCPSLY